MLGSLYSTPGPADGSRLISLWGLRIFSQPSQYSTYGSCGNGPCHQLCVYSFALTNPTPDTADYAYQHHTEQYAFDDGFHGGAIPEQADLDRKFLSALR
jgi:hypothetical protein